MAIMLVERDRELRETAHIWLINRGCTAIALAYAEVALQCLRSGGYNMLITSDEALGKTCCDEKLVEHVMADERPVFMRSFADGAPAAIREILDKILTLTQ